MAQLDLFEGVAENCYRRAPVQVSTQVGEVLACVVYSGEAFSTEVSIPNANYLDSIVTGAEALSEGWPFTDIFLTARTRRIVARSQSTLVAQDQPSFVSNSRVTDLPWSHRLTNRHI
jgi:AIG2-like family